MEPSLCSRDAFFRYALVSMIGGLFFGFVIGYVPIYTEFELLRSNCSLRVSKESCEELEAGSSASDPSSFCVWNSTLSLCDFSVVCSEEEERNSGGSSSNPCRPPNCFFSQTARRCLHISGFTATQSGIFAGAMIVGGMFGSLPAGTILGLIGYTNCFRLAGAFSVLSCVGLQINIAAQREPVFTVLVGLRFVQGVVCGFLCVICPGYILSMCPSHISQSIGVMYQICSSIGVATSGGVGWGLSPKTYDAPLSIKARVQAFTCLSSLVSVGVLGLSFTVRSAPSRNLLNVEEGTASEKENLVINPVVPVEEGRRDHRVGELSKTQILPFVIASVTLAFCMQFTGINAVVNFAPSILNIAGIPPLAGNFGLMALKSSISVSAIPLAKLASMRTFFLLGVSVVTLSSMLLAIIVHPSISVASSVRAGVGCTALATFCVAFALGMGPSFYILTQSVFPSRYRSRGASMTMLLQFVCNIVVNVAFPISVEAFSGGPGENQAKGMSIVFGFFSVCGVLSLLVLIPFLREYHSC